MNEKGDKTARNKTAMNLAGISEFVGMIFCVLGVVSGIYHMVNSLSLGGCFGTALADHGVLSDRGRRAIADRCRTNLASGDR
jgi:Na+/glutamate symporter